MILGSVLKGFTGIQVMVEVDFKRGIPNTIITGLPRGALLESVDRIRTSIKNSGFTYPYEKILVNLSPASIIKSGTGFDLPIALAILEEQNLIAKKEFSIVAMGELQLSGKIIAVDGILNAILSLQDSVDYFIVPKDTVKSSFEKDPRILEVDSLIEAVDTINHLEKSVNNNILLEGYKKKDKKYEKTISFNYCKLSTEIIGALMLSAASGLHTFLYGPPGEGKSYSGEFLYHLLPKNHFELALEVSKIHSSIGEYGKDGLLYNAPYRHPHHSASVEGVIGGGKEMLPGEITLAHGGLLFLDEATEFKPTILQSLREPMETGEVSISRVGEKILYPADFQLLLSSNLCPCGEFGRYGSLCLCSIKETTRYWNRIGGALFDRISIRIPYYANNSQPNKIDYFSLQEKVERVHNQLNQSLNNISFRHAPIEKILQIFPQTEQIMKYIIKKGEKEAYSLRQLNNIIRISLTLSLFKRSSVITKEAINAAIKIMKLGNKPRDIEFKSDIPYLSDIAIS